MRFGVAFAQSKLWPRALFCRFAVIPQRGRLRIPPDFEIGRDIKVGSGEGGVVGRRANRSEPVNGDAGPWAGAAANLSRRAVLRAGTLGVAAVGAAAAFPTIVGEFVANGPEVVGGAAETPAVAAEMGSAPAGLGLIVAHIRDAASGEISLLVGEREITYRDPELIQQLTRAAR